MSRHASKHRPGRFVGKPQSPPDNGADPEGVHVGPIVLEPLYEVPFPFGRKSVVSLGQQLIANRPPTDVMARPAIGRSKTQPNSMKPPRLIVRESKPLDMHHIGL